MDSRVSKFFDYIKGKRIAVCGLAVSNRPLVPLFAEHGAEVSVYDKKSRAELGTAADEAEAAGAALHLSGEGMDDIDADILIRTPGMYFGSPLIKAARERGITVTSEMEIFFDICPATKIAVTGSDGKSTTTTLISEMLKAEGKRVHLGGNIGKNLLSHIFEIQPEDYAVVELSSFQLISMRESPDIAVVTNVRPNHLDVHGNMEEYTDAKRNIYRHQSAFSKTVLNADDAVTASFAEDIRGCAYMFSAEHGVERGAYLKDGVIYMAEGGRTERIMDESDIRLVGRHNTEDYLAAISAVYGLCSKESMRRVAVSFNGVEHRCEFVRERGGVKWYNDSIATSPTRTIAGLKAFDQKVILIAGGYDKHVPFDPIAPYVCEKVKAMILMGDTAEKIEKAVTSYKDYDPTKLAVYHADSMEQAVSIADGISTAGDIVFLSPVSASFDKYPNFEARGRHFKDIVRNLK